MATAPTRLPVFLSIANSFGALSAVCPAENSSDDELKDYIASIVGSKPRGNPSRETLVRMAREAAQQEAA